MPTTLETTRYARALETERRIVATNIAAHEREGRRSSGVCMSGMGPAHYTPPTEAEIEAQTRQRADRMAAWALTFEGRLRTEISAAQRALLEANNACEEIRNALSRGDSADIMGRIERLKAITDRAVACVEAAGKVVA